MTPARATLKEPTSCQELFKGRPRSLQDEAAPRVYAAPIFAGGGGAVLLGVARRVPPFSGRFLAFSDLGPA